MGIASLSIVLALDASHSYAAMASATAALNCFAYYEAPLTAVDQIEFALVSSGLSVSTNGTFTVTGATTQVWQFLSGGEFSQSAQWYATATAVYYPRYC